MAHVRHDSSRPTTTISFNPAILAKVEDYKFENRKDNRSQAIEELIKFGLKYVALVEKKKQRERMMV